MEKEISFWDWLGDLFSSKKKVNKIQTEKLEAYYTWLDAWELGADYHYLTCIVLVPKSICKSLEDIKDLSKELKITWFNKHLDGTVFLKTNLTKVDLNPRDYVELVFSNRDSIPTRTSGRLLYTAKTLELLSKLIEYFNSKSNNKVKWSKIVYS